MSPHRPGSLAALAAALTLAWLAPARAADPADHSLRLVPADVSFYSTSLRLGEQMDRFLASNAYAKLRALPAAKYALEQWREAAAKPDNPLGPFLKALQEPANRELLGLLNDLWRQEVIGYGGANWAQLLPVMAEINGAIRFAPLKAQLSGGNPNLAQAQAALEVLNNHADKLQVPEFVLGFRLTQKDAAESQIKRLEALLTQVTESHPKFKGRVKRAKVAGVDALTLTLDGAMIPWDEIKDDELGEIKDELKKLVATLKTRTLTASLLVKGDYLLLAVGPGTATAEAFGRGPALATRPELRPLAQFADKPLIAVGYTSRALAAATATTGEDIEGLAEMAKAGLAKAPISEQRQKLIVDDLQKLAKDITALLPTPAASLSLTFLTPHGQESYHYDYAPARTAAAQPLTVLDHLGGSPLVAGATRVGDPTPGYKALVKWLKVFYGHFEAVVREKAPEDQQQHFQTIVQIVQPFLKRFDDITGTMLLPGLGAGQLAVVLDAKWTSRAWFHGFNQNGKALPMLELGVVRTVRDSALVLKAGQEYRVLANDLLAKAREFGAPIPPEGVPKPEESKTSAGALYFWPLPAAGQDDRIQPNVGLSEKALVFSLSLKHSERLLTPTPLKVEGGPLAERRPITAASVVDFAGLIGAVRPWIEQLALPAALAQVPADAPKGLTRADIPEQVRTVLDVLQCFRGYTSVTYRDGDATVTHGETVFRDVK